MKNTLIKINQLMDGGIIKKYAIGGGIACSYYVEPTTTYDLDVMIILSKEENMLHPLKDVYKWAEENNFQIKEEHIVIDGIPVQFLPAYNELVKDLTLELKHSYLVRNI